MRRTMVDINNNPPNTAPAIAPTGTFRLALYRKILVSNSSHSEFKGANWELVVGVGA